MAIIPPSSYRKFVQPGGVVADFTFDSIAHEYFLGSKKLYGVTTVIKDCGLMGGTEYFTDEARDRGTAVHRACELLMWDNLDFSSLDERIEGYVRSCERYLKATGFRPKRTEFRAYHPELEYAGSWDADDDVLLLDEKSGGPSAWHKIQTAGYFELARVNGIKLRRRGGLYLQADGSIAKFREHTDRNDLKVFLSCLNLCKWKDQS